MKNKLFFCYSPAMSDFLQAKGLDCVGEGLNVNTGKRFRQFIRGAELDEAINEWQANNPNNKRK